jgi:GNAT superfamily N-acetyltransferase
MERIICQHAQPNELSIVLQLLNDAAIWLRARQIAYWQNWLNPPPAHVQWIQEGFRQQQFYLAYRQELLVGCFRLQWADETFWGQRDDCAGYIHSFTTVRTFYGQRIGEQILQWIEAYCRQQGKQYLRLDCGSHVTGLRRYYERYGFQVVGETTVMNDVLTLYEKPI